MMLCYSRNRNLPSFKRQYPTLPMFLSKSDEQISKGIILQRKYKVKRELFTFGCNNVRTLCTNIVLYEQRNNLR